MSEIFSFIIISFNRVEDTIDAVKNVFQLDNAEGWEKEIVVLNNGSSTDYSALENYLASLFPEEKKLIHYINHSQNLGVAGGRNFCIREAKGKYLLFMDDDSEIMNKNVIPKVLSLYKKYEPESLAIIGFLGKNPFTGKTETPLKNPKLIEGKSEVFYNLFFGYGHVFPKSLIAETGFYQDDFFYGMEEYDLSYATVKAGHSIIFTEEITVLHKINSGGREPSKITYLRMFHNKIIVVYKYLPALYVATHFLLWSAFFLTKSKFDVITYFKTLPQLRNRLRAAHRNVIGKDGMNYLNKVGARLWY